MCFSLGWIEHLLVWLVILAAVVALLKLLLPLVLQWFGVAGNIIMQAINIVVWAIVAIAIIYFVFALIGCLLSAGGDISVLPHR